jgi:hypothetical protein
MPEIIESYGLFWDAADVAWDIGGNKRALLGAPAWQKKAVPINFATQVGIYVLYSGHKMIYVGQVGSGRATLFGRLRRHRHDRLARRWDRFSWFGLRVVKDNGTLGTVRSIKRSQLNTILNQMEAILVAAAEPVLNKQGGRFGRRHRYVQIWDERLGPTESEMIQEIYDHLKGQE